MSADFLVRLKELERRVGELERKQAETDLKWAIGRNAPVLTSTEVGKRRGRPPKILADG